MRTDAADFNDWRFRRETGGAGGRFERRRNLQRGGFADRAAALANKKHHQVAGRVGMNAGDEGVAALDAVDETVLTQELQGAVDGDWRRAGPLRRQPLHDLIGADGLMAGEQGRQHVAPDWG